MVNTTRLQINNMGKLYELATLCLNTKEFYTVQGGVICNYRDKSEINFEIEFGLNNSTITPVPDNIWVFKDVFHNKYGENKYHDLFRRKLQINFVDEPPIFISIHNKIVDFIRNIEGSLVIPKETFWGQNDITYKFTYNKSTYKQVFVITCGSLTEEISKEQYKTLIDLYNQNNEAFKQAADMLRVEERIEALKKINVIV